MQRVVSLFPRYLFVQLDHKQQSLAPVRSTVGVASIVRFGPESSVVPNRIVEALMSSADPESGLHRIEITRKFERGSRVDVVAGALEGLQGIFEREAGDERVVILLTLLGEQTAVQVPSQFVVCSG